MEGGEARHSQAKFARETVDQLSKLSFSQDKTKYNSEALSMTSEMIRVYVLEAAHRAAARAKSDGSGRVEAEHLEKILPQFLLDFA